MRFKKQWFLIGMLALSLSTVTNVSAESVSSMEKSTVLEAGENSITVDESSKINGRKMYGLPTDSSVIESFKKENFYSKIYGIYLSPNEEAELEKRFKLQDKIIPELRREVLSMISKDDYLGMYIDQEAGGTVNIGIRKGRAMKNIENLLISKFSSPELPIKFYEATYSESELDRIMDDINANINDLRKQINIQYASVNFINQKIEAGIKGEFSSISDAVKVISNLTKQDESLFQVKIIDGTYKTSDDNRYTTQSPILNGLVIDDTSGTTGWCSVAFSAIDSNSNPYIVTAAHCWNSGTGMFQGSNYIGHVSSKWHYGNNADAAAIAVTSNNFLSNKVYGTSTLLTNVQVAGNDVLGERICKSGMWGNSCGTLLSKNNSGYWGPNDTWFDNLRVSNYYSDGGDSGGSIYNDNDNTLKGVHKGSYTQNGTTYRVYSHVTNVANRLNITPVNWLNR